MPSTLTLCNTQQCLQDLDSFIIKHLMCAQYLPQWSTVLEIWISVQRFPVSGHTGVLDSSPSPHLVLFPGTGPRWRSKKIMVASGMFGISVSFISIFIPLLVSQRIWVGCLGQQQQKKGGRGEFFLCHPQSKNNKMDVYFWRGPQSSPRARPWLCGLCVGPGRALLSEGTTCSSALHCHRCVTMGRPCPPEKCW